MSQNPVSGREESVGSDSSIGPRGTKGSARFEYVFGRDGGVVATIFLRGPVLPDNAVIKDAYIDIITVPTSGGAATIALGFESTTDINAADAISGAPWSSVGPADADGPEPGTEGSYVKLTQARGLRMTVGTAALTAGHFAVVVEFDVTG